MEIFILIIFILRFIDGPRIPGAKYIDMDDIATSKDLYPDLNPKGLSHLLPTKVIQIAIGNLPPDFSETLFLYHSMHFIH